SGNWEYLGEWHSHPGKIGPSHSDILSLMKIRIDPAYSIEDPVMGINIFSGNSWQFHCFLLSGPKILELNRKTK
ncbi:MAG: Mov34/MPN/PAD-1 family protein, partial [Chloroflexi bacterium]|nr:Mov34/MPN/PAD-1 family protein [Chloroflexota bacterium]